MLGRLLLGSARGSWRGWQQRAKESSWRQTVHGDIKWRRMRMVGWRRMKGEM
jgi:hypothetical protein